MNRFLTARWEHLLMLNYEVDPGLLASLVPTGVELDTWQSRNFISLVGFCFFNARLLGAPIPFHRNFQEVNLRFYVRRSVGSEIRRGVVFISEVVRRRAIAMIAKWVYNEKYVCRPTTHSLTMPECEKIGRIEYQWGPLSAGAEFVGDATVPASGSHEEFISEHYWGYSRQRNGGTIEYRVDHPRWRVWPAKQSWLDGNALSLYDEDFAKILSAPATSAFVADGSPVIVYRGRRLMP